MSDQTTAAATLVDVLQNRAARAPERRAYTFLVDGEAEGERWTYGELDRRARAVAALLQRRHLAGERALLIYPPGGLEFLAAFYGCLYAGIVAIPAPPPDATRLKRALPRLQTIAVDSSASIILGTASVLELLEKIDDSLPALAGLQRLATEQTPDEWADEWQRPELGGDTLAYLQYTSGSTSSPKGVMLEHSHVLHNLAYNRRRWGYGSDSGAVCWMPYFHDYGLVEGLMQPAYSGIPAYILSPLAFLRRPLRWLQAISRYRLTHSASPNFGFDHCVERIPKAKREGLDLSSWRVASCGAEVVRAETMERFIAAFAPHGLSADALYPAYGLAEATLLVTTRAAEESMLRVLELDPAALEAGRAQPAGEGRPERRVVSCGTADGDMRLAIVDPESRRRRGEGEVGEVWVCSPSVAAGYWRHPEASEEVLRARLVDDQGGESEETYLRTGDLGFLHAGELYVSGRMKDLIIVRGSNHFPEDVEMTVEAAHPLLRSNACAAFSIESEGEERLAVAAEVERKFTAEQLDEVVGAIRQAVAESHDVEVWAVRLLKRGSVLKTSSGKIQRAGSRQAFLDGELEVVGEHTARQPPGAPAEVKSLDAGVGRRNEIEAWLVARLAARLGMAGGELDRTQPFARYGIDSAAAVSLVGELEEWLERELPETLLYEHPTVHRLSAYLAGAPAARAEGDRGLAQATDTAEPVAIIGLDCRFPGAAGAPAFWQLLSKGVDAIRPVPEDRWDAEALYDPEPATPGKSNSRWGGFLDAVDLFDADFFGISPREAARMDPQQRLILEVAWGALENAGIVPGRLAGSATGVFVGISTNDYRALQNADRARIDAYAGTGNALSIAANRLSYTLDLRGPSLAIDTACSSSLVAVHTACRSLRDGECSLALAGGVNLMLEPEWSLTFAQARMMASDGRCKTFDAAADGYVRGEGCGVVALKRLSDARRDGDRVLAVILGSAVNQDGRSNGLTAPNGSAQEDVVRRALAVGGVRPSEVTAVEAHGTGTPLGDPIEVRALAAVLGEEREPSDPFWLTSVKTNIGHLESAAGIAGLIKTVLSLDQQAIPEHLHFNEGNPRLDWKHLPARVPTALTPWERGEQRRIAGVSAFGFGGTNCHVVVAEAPAQKVKTPQRLEGQELFVLSARSPQALERQARAWGAELALNTAPWNELCAAAALRRTHFGSRLALVAESAPAAASTLTDFAAGRPAALHTGSRPAARAPRIGFLFTGQGAQHPGMGRQLYAGQPAYRAALDRCADILAPRLEYPLLTVMHGDGWESELLHQTAYTQPCLFALEYALAEMWRAWGVVPHAVLGHSVGEYVAACVSGVLELEAALELVAERGRLMQELPEGGAMASVLESEPRVLGILDRAGVEVSVAAVNGPGSTVLSGSADALDAAIRALSTEDVECRRLRVSHAFHSPLMEPAMERFESFAAKIEHGVPHIPLIANLDGQAWTGNSAPDAAYWRRHALAGVRFAAGVESLEELGCEVLLELGPHPTLCAMARRCLPPAKVRLFHSLHRDEEDELTVLEALGGLFATGVEPRWEALYDAQAALPTGLPTYRFEPERHWLDPEPVVSASKSSTEVSIEAAREPTFPWLGERRMQDAAGALEWRLEVSVAAFPFLDDHRVQGVLVLPAACYLEMVLEAAEKEWGEAAREVRGLSVHRALFLPEEGSISLLLEIAPVATADAASTMSSSMSKCRFRILAGEEGAEPELYADGTIEAAPTAESEELDPMLDLDGMRDDLGQPTPGAEVYRQLAALGLDYGPCHQAIAEIYAGEGEALSRLETPGQLEAEVGSYRLHPALLDSAWQTLAAAIPSRLASSGSGVPWLPVALARFRLYRVPPRDLWCRAKVQQLEGGRGQRLAVDLLLVDGAGRVVAHCDELVVQRLEPGASRATTEPLLELRWKPLAPLALASATEASLPESWLLVGDRAEPLAALAEELRSRGIKASTGGPRGADFELPAGDEQRLLELAAALPEDLSGVALLWSGGAGASPMDERTQQNTDLSGVVTAVSLARVLAGRDRAAGIRAAGIRAAGDRAARLWLVTHGAQEVRGSAKGESLPASALWGLGRTLAQELPGHWGGAIDLDPERASEASVAALAEELLTPRDSLSGDVPEDQIALRAGERYGARLHPLAVLPSSERFVPRADAAYLITGGLGDLGLATARWLVDLGARELLLVGRTPLCTDPEAGSPTGERDRKRFEAVKALRESGASIVTVALDIGEPGAIERLLEQRREAGSLPVRGVIHAAGTVIIEPVTEASAASVASVLRPKIEGSLELDRAFGSAEELDFFVCYSSVSAVLASPRLGPYAAANAFLDALAHRRRRDGLPALSIGWPGWSEVGMAARHGVVPAKGMGTVQPTQAFDWLERWLAPGMDLPPAITLLPVDWQRWAATYPAATRSPALSGLLAKSAESGKPGAVAASLPQAAGERREHLLEALSAQLSSVLELPAERIDRARPLNRLGLDSLMAVELKNRIETELGVSLSVVTFLKGPSLEELATMLEKELAPADGSGSEPEREPERPLEITFGSTLDGAEILDRRKAERLLDSMDDLSDDQVSALLDRVLELEEAR